MRRLPLAELADLLASLDREPAWWRGLYAALADASAEELAELGALPVPLADGRLVRGPRGLLLPGSGLDHPDRLAVLGLRVVAPEAAHPLLARLGAVEATPRTVLEDAATRAAVAASYDAAVEAGYDDDGPERVADAVLGLVAALDAEPGEYPYLADLALPGDDGDWYPAGELLLPGSPLAEVIAADVPFGTVDQATVGRYGARALEAAGVLSSFGLITAEDVELDESAIDLDLDGVEDWAADSVAVLGESGLPPVALEVTAVRDLDLVDPGRWQRALELLARPPLRAALVDPTRVRLADGRHADVPSYTAWWLRRHLMLDGRRPGDLRGPDSDPLLAGLYDPIGGDGPLADPVIARALGVRTSLADLLAEPGGPDELLARLADPARPVSRPQLRALWAALAAAGDALAELLAPSTRCAPSVAPRSCWPTPTTCSSSTPPTCGRCWPTSPSCSPRTSWRRGWPTLLDLPLASEEIAGSLDSPGQRRPVPSIVAAVLPDAPSHYQAHDKLTVDGIELPWRYLDGEIHAARRPAWPRPRLAGRPVDPPPPADRSADRPRRRRPGAGRRRPGPSLGRRDRARRDRLAGGVVGGPAGVGLLGQAERYAPELLRADCGRLRPHGAAVFERDHHVGHRIGGRPHDPGVRAFGPAGRGPALRAEAGDVVAGGEAGSPRAEVRGRSPRLPLDRS